MLRSSNKINTFKENRQVFRTENSPEATPRNSNTQEGKEVVDKAAKEAIDRAIAKGKASAIKAKSLEIPVKMPGLQFDIKEAKPPVPPNGTIEQPFQFGDLKMKGKIIFPDNPDQGPKAKTTYLFNYVDNPNDFDHSKFLQKLKDKKADLGNTVIITLRTPEGETKVSREKVNTMQKLLAEVEQYQTELSKNERFAKIKMPKATDILHMTSYADMEKANRTTAMLAKYAKQLNEVDDRWLKHAKVLDTKTPETLAASLDKVFAHPAQPEPKQQQQPQKPHSASVVHAGGGVQAPKYGGGGSRVATQPTESTGGDSSSASSEFSSDQAPTENKENRPVVDKLLVIGDSLMIGAKEKLRAKSRVEKSKETVEGGRQLSEMLRRLKKWDKEGKLNVFRNETMVINGGTNDLGRLKIPGTNGDLTKENIFGYMQEVWKIAKKYNIKVYQCAIPPFGGTNYRSLGNKFEEREDAREWINAKMRKAVKEGTEGPAGIIELDLPKSKGGLGAELPESEEGLAADSSDAKKKNVYPDYLASEYRAGDGIHFTDKGVERMASAIQKAIGEPKSPESHS